MPDNAVIHRILQNALDNHCNNSENNRPPRNVLEKLYNAHDWVWKQRLNGRCDENWAIAEHYFYARYHVAARHDSATWMTFLALGYNSAKSILGRHRNVVRENDRCNVSQPSIAAVQWAARGAMDGENDRQNINHTNRLFAPERPELPS